jgi:hypothetical protein
MAFSIGNTARAYLASFPGDPDIKTLGEAKLKSTAGMELAGAVPAMNQLASQQLAQTQMGIDGTLAQQEMINAVKMAEIDALAKQSKNQSLLSLLSGIGSNRKAGSSLSNAMGIDAAFGSPITKANLYDAQLAADPLASIDVLSKTPTALFKDVDEKVTKPLTKSTKEDFANDPNSNVYAVMQKWGNKYKNFKEGLKNQ